jgi:hypothetical protein
LGEEPKLLALEDATAELVERGLKVRLVVYGVVIWLCAHRESLELVAKLGIGREPHFDNSSEKRQRSRL